MHMKTDIRTGLWHRSRTAPSRRPDSGGLVRTKKRTKKGPVRRNLSWNDDLALELMRFP